MTVKTGDDWLLELEQIRVVERQLYSELKICADVAMSEYLALVYQYESTYLDETGLDS